jgi:hypothetical protein
MGGFLDLFGIREWFYSLPKEEQEKITRYYSQGMNTNPDDLFNNQILHTSLTGTKLLSTLAINSIHNKDHILSKKLLQKAHELIKNEIDSSYYENALKATSQLFAFIPDQKDINKYKDKIISLIKQNQGILQTKLKKLFKENEDSIVGYALSQLRKEGKIKREKKGNSFELYS